MNDIELKEKLIKFIHSIRALNNGMENIELLDQLESTEEIFPYSGRYFNMDPESIKNEMIFLQNSLEGIRNYMEYADKVKETASKTLITTGHPEITIRELDPGEMLRIIYHKVMAAKGTLWAIQQKKGMIISKNDIKDGIAEALKQELK
jgi:hypothetical protein